MGQALYKWGQCSYKNFFPISPYEIPWFIPPKRWTITGARTQELLMRARPNLLCQPGKLCQPEIHPFQAVESRSIRCTNGYPWARWLDYRIPISLDTTWYDPCNGRPCTHATWVELHLSVYPPHRHESTRKPAFYKPPANYIDPSTHGWCSVFVVPTK